MNNKCFGRSFFRPLRPPVGVVWVKEWKFVGSMCKLKCIFSSLRRYSTIYLQMLDWNATKKLTLLNKLFSFTFRHILTNKAVKDGGMLDLSIRNRQGKTVLHYLGPIFSIKLTDSKDSDLSPESGCVNNHCCLIV